MDIATYIDNPALLNHETLAELRSLVEKYPFYQAARLLYVANLYALRERSFGEELRRASVLVPDRRALYLLAEGKYNDVESLAYKQQPAQKTVAAGDDDRTTALIDSFLSAQDDGEAQTGEKRTVPTIADVTSDYAAFLEMQDDLEAPADAGDDAVADLIDNFLKETQGRQRYELQAQEEDADRPATPSAAETDDTFNADIYNDKIVNMLIQQGHYEQGLEILRKICLKKPEKSATFAPQIRLLEVIVEKNKTQK